MQFTFDHFKDIKEIKSFTRDTKFYTQKKKKKEKKNCTPISCFSLLEIHKNIKAVRGCGLFSAIWVCVYIYIYIVTEVANFTQIH